MKWNPKSIHISLQSILMMNIHHVRECLIFRAPLKCQNLLPIVLTKRIDAKQTIVITKYTLCFILKLLS